jgi:hypothetical protein
MEAGGVKPVKHDKGELRAKLDEWILWIKQRIEADGDIDEHCNHSWGWFLPALPAYPSHEACRSCLALRVLLLRRTLRKLRTHIQIGTSLTLTRTQRNGSANYTDQRTMRRRCPKERHGAKRFALRQVLHCVTFTCA